MTSPTSGHPPHHRQAAHPNTGWMTSPPPGRKTPPVKASTPEAPCPKVRKRFTTANSTPIGGDSSSYTVNKTQNHDHEEDERTKVIRLLCATPNWNRPMLIVAMICFTIIACVLINVVGKHMR